MSEFTEESWQIRKRLAPEFDGLKAPGSIRGRLAGASLDLALEHHSSVLRLTDAALYGTAAAIVRLEWECYVRGAWLYFAAPDVQVQRFYEKDQIPRLATLVPELEKHEAFNVGVLSAIKEESSQAMNSMTHGGMRQLSQRITEEEIRPNYHRQDVAMVVDAGTVIGIWAYGAMAHMAGATDKQLMLRDVMESFQGSALDQ